MGGHVRAYGALPYRQQYGTIATWLAAQASGNGTEIKLERPVNAENLDVIVAAEKPDHIVVATDAAYRRDGFQGQTGKPISGWETGRCVSWDHVALDRVIAVPGEVLVVDEMPDVAAPLTAVKLAKGGAKVRLLTRSPMIGMETMPDVYFHWIMTYLQEAGVELITSHTVRQIIGNRVEITDVYQPKKSRRINADLIVMATARTSETEIYRLLRERHASIEAIGCVLAPRTVYEATLEGHRAARKLSDYGGQLRNLAAALGLHSVVLDGDAVCQPYFSCRQTAVKVGFGVFSGGDPWHLQLPRMFLWPRLPRAHGRDQLGTTKVSGDGRWTRPCSIQFTGSNSQMHSPSSSPIRNGLVSISSPVAITSWTQI